MKKEKKGFNFKMSTKKLTRILTKASCLRVKSENKHGFSCSVSFPVSENPKEFCLDGLDGTWWNVSCPQQQQCHGDRLHLRAVATRNRFYSNMEGLRLSVSVHFNFIFAEFGKNAETVTKHVVYEAACCTVTFKMLLFCCFSLGESSGAVVRAWRSCVAVDTVNLRKHR